MADILDDILDDNNRILTRDAVNILIQDIVDPDENGVPRGTARDRITALDFSNMNIYEIDVGAFQDLNLPALEDIILTYNGINNLLPGTFNGLDQLQTINLSYNALTYLDPAVFNDLEQLTGIDLEGNEDLEFDDALEDFIDEFTDQYGRWGTIVLDRDLRSPGNSDDESDEYSDEYSDDESDEYYDVDDEIIHKGEVNGGKRKKKTRKPKKTKQTGGKKKLKKTKKQKQKGGKKSTKKSRKQKGNKKSTKKTKMQKGGKTTSKRKSKRKTKRKSKKKSRK